MALGGLLSSHFGWRWAFAGMALFGLAVVALFRLCITESRVLAQRRAWRGRGPRPPPRPDRAAPAAGRPLLGAVHSRAYAVGSALQLLVMSALLAWIPSFPSRYYGMATDRVGVTAAGCAGRRDWCMMLAAR